MSKENKNKTQAFTKHPALIEKSSYTVSETSSLPSDPNYFADVVRGGVIPYINQGKVRKYCLGVDRKSGDISPFMGKILASDKTVVDGCMREWEEESLNVFASYKQKKVVLMHTKRMAIIFIRFDIEADAPIAAFRAQVKNTPASEMKDILWFTHTEFGDMIWRESSYNLYDRARNFLRSAFHRKSMIEILN